MAIRHSDESQNPFLILNQVQNDGFRRDNITFYNDFFILFNLVCLPNFCASYFPLNNFFNITVNFFWCYFSIFWPKAGGD